MKRIYARPGEVMDFYSSVNDGEECTVVVQTTNMEISRLHLAMNSRIPIYEAQGEIVILCMAGMTEVRSMDTVMTLASGQALYLSQAEPFSLEATQESSLLIVTVSGSHRGKSYGNSSPSNNPA